MTNSSIYGTPGFCSQGSTIFTTYSHAGDSGSSGSAFYDRVYLYEWTAASHWTAMNGGAEVSIPYTGSPPSANAWEPAVACATSGNPMVAWVEMDPPSSDADHALLAEVTSSSVTRSAPLSRNSSSGSYATDVYTVGIAVDGSGNTYLAHWEQHHSEQWRSDLYVTRYSGGTFTPLGASLGQDYDSNNLCVPSVAVDASGNVYVAFTLANSLDYTRHAYVYRYDGSWTLHLCRPLGRDGGSWVIDGNKLNTNLMNAAADPDLAYCVSDGCLYVAFEENTDGWYHIFVKRKLLSP